jgi:hypothetical protein
VTPKWSPFGNAYSERTEAAKIRTIAQLRRYLATGFAGAPEESGTTQKARANEPLKGGTNATI